MKFAFHGRFSFFCIHSFGESQVLDMMESLILSAQCVLPVLMLIAVGMLIRKLGWINASGISQMDRVVFRILLPVVLFQNIYTSDFHAEFDSRLVLVSVLFSLISFIIAIFASGLVQKEPARRASLAQGMFRNNSMVYGLSIITALYGASAAGIFSMLLALIIPLNNILAVVILTLLTSKRFRPLALFQSILTNPFVIAAALGFAGRLLRIPCPSFISSSLQNLGQAATPIAMLLLGASLKFSAVQDYRTDIICGITVKLLGLSMILLPAAIALGMRGVPLVSVYLNIGTPCAVSSHIMAKQMGADGELAGHLVVFGAIFSILSIFLVLTVLGMTGLL